MSKITEGELYKDIQEGKSNSLVELHPLNLHKSVRSRPWRGQVKTTQE